MVDPKDVIIEDLKRTLAKLERSLRSAGIIEFKPWHTTRDRVIAAQFVLMANEARGSLEFSKTLENKNV